MLYQRLNELTSGGLVEQADDGDYRLSALGSDLGQALERLDRWARRWSTEFDDRT